jgi:hypothetical protein
LLNSTVRTLEDALQYRLQYEAPDKLCGLYRSLTFHLQIYTFLSGAEGIRTPDLRRAKAALSRLSYGPVIQPGGASLPQLR